MKIIEHSYGGKTFRPKPIVHIDSSAKLIISCASWSTKSFAQEVIEGIVSLYGSLSEDTEATSPFERIESLTLKQNNLRTAVLLTNREIADGKNGQEYMHGCELFVGLQEGELFSWIQIGNPSLFLKKPSSQLISLSTRKDLSLDFASDILNPPLPDSLYGVQRTISIEVQSCKARPSDKLYLLSSSLIQPFIHICLETSELNQMANRLSSTQPNAPFWLAQLSLKPY